MRESSGKASADPTAVGAAVGLVWYHTRHTHSKWLWWLESSRSVDHHVREYRGRVQSVHVQQAVPRVPHGPRAEEGVGGGGPLHPGLPDPLLHDSYRRTGGMSRHRVESRL